MVASRVAFISISICLSLAFDPISGKEEIFHESNLSFMATLANEVSSQKFDSLTSPQLRYRTGDRFLSFENTMKDVCYCNSTVVGDKRISFRYDYVLECKLDPCSNEILKNIESSIQETILNVSVTPCKLASENEFEADMLEDTTKETTFVGITYLPEDRFSLTDHCFTNDNKTQIPVWCQVVEGELTLLLPNELHFSSTRAILEEVESLVLEGLMKFHDGDSKVIKSLQLTFEAYRVIQKSDIHQNDKIESNGLILLIMSILIFSVLAIILGVTHTKHRAAVINNRSIEEEARDDLGIQLSDDASTHFEEGLMDVIEIWSRSGTIEK